MILVAIWCISGGLIGYIASTKGHSFLKWFIYGAIIWPVALVHVLFVGTKGKKCPKCISYIPAEATRCRFCQYDYTSVAA